MTGNNGNANLLHSASGNTHRWSLLALAEGSLLAPISQLLLLGTGCGTQVRWLTVLNSEHGRVLFERVTMIKRSHIKATSKTHG